MGIICITDIPRRFTIICLRTTQTLLYPAGSDSNKSGRGPHHHPIWGLCIYILYTRGRSILSFHAFQYFVPPHRYYNDFSLGFAPVIDVFKINVNIIYIHNYFYREMHIRCLIGKKLLAVNDDWTEFII